MRLLIIFSVRRYSYSQNKKVSLVSGRHIGGDGNSTERRRLSVTLQQHLEISNKVDGDFDLRGVIKSSEPLARFASAAFFS